MALSMLMKMEKLPTCSLLEFLKMQYAREVVLSYHQELSLVQLIGGGCYNTSKIIGGSGGRRVKRPLKIENSSML